MKTLTSSLTILILTLFLISCGGGGGGGDTDPEPTPIADADSDGIADASDNCPNTANAGQEDLDSDNTGDACDTDIDGDNVANANDAFPSDPAESVDTDGDGTGDNSDPDIDGDQVLNDADAFPSDPAESIDTDGDGIGNNADTDDDNDGVLDAEDDSPLSANDFDQDGILDVNDPDDDNDSVLDTDDAFPFNASESVDTDGDGIGDNADADRDGDNVLNDDDAFPLDSAESVDTDADGIGNNADTDDDGDGVADGSDAFPLDSAETLDTDSDGIGNNADTDDDGDTLTDSQEADKGTDPLLADTDGDTVDDASDAYPLDSSRSSLGAVTLTGAVTVFPDSTTSSGSSNKVKRMDYRIGNNISSLSYSSKSRDKYSQLNEDTSTSISRTDMVPASALVSIFLLTDVDFANPVATVATDAEGNYQIRVEDVRDYLLANNKISESSSDDDIITAFRALGKLQVRALVVKQQSSGEKKAIAIQSIADPADVDETTGEPKPVAVDPIVHRVVKAVVEKVKEAINSLKDMGLSDAIVDSLATTVVESIASEITRVVEEAKDSVIEIPEGQTFEDVVNQQESEFEVEVTEEEVSSLETVIAGQTNQQQQQEAIAQLESSAVKADEKVSEEDSTLSSTLDSESQGLLAGLESALSDNVVEKADETIEEAQNSGDDGALAAIFGVSTEDENAAAELEAKLAAQEAEKNRQLAKGLKQFFLSMGFAVIVDENTAGDGGVVAVNLPVPFQMTKANIPGGRGFNNRNTRLFKVGDGTLNEGSLYTTDSTAALGVLDDSGKPQAPLYYAPPLSEVVSNLLGDNSISEFQLLVDEAYERIIDFDSSPSAADFALIDRLRLLHELNWRLQGANLISGPLVNKLVSNKTATVKIKRLASIIAENFTWKNEVINLTPDGFPIYTGRVSKLAGGKDTVESSEIVRALSITVGETASATAKQLTEKVSFYAQYAPDAVQAKLQQADFTTDLLTTLLAIYPETAAAYRTLIIGDAANGIPAAQAYKSARDRVAKGLTSAVPTTLFGKTLSSETAINVRSALFFLDFVLKSNYLINSQNGFFTQFDFGDEQTRLVPNYENIKFMEPKSGVTMSTIVSSLLNITKVEEGAYFGLVRPIVKSGLSGLPELPEFKEQSEDDLQEFISSEGRNDLIEVQCTVEMFDGSDAATRSNPLQLQLIPVEYDELTGSFQKGEPIDSPTILSSYDATTKSTTYTIQDVESSYIDDSSNTVYGRDYVLRFDIASYESELPELFFWADGFVPNLQLCDSQFPLFIGPDQKFVPVPGLGLVADQSYFDGNGNLVQEGLDLSNFEEPGAPIYLTETDEVDGFGAIDIFFSSTSEGYDISAGNEEVGFAPLFGGYVDGSLEISLTESESHEALYGIQSVIGASIRDVILAVIDDETVLSDAISLDADNEQFEYDRLYLMRDAEGKYWIIEVRYLDVFEDFDGQQSAFIDIGFAAVNSLGQISIPEASFDDVPISDDFSEGNTSIFYENMLYGDWLVLTPPTDYTGPRLMEPEEVSFGGNSELYDQLEAATDGVLIRYSSGHFEENITTVDDFDTVFGNPADYSTIPVRIDAGRSGITFVKLSMNKNTKTYVMTPDLENTAAFVTNLKHNDIVAIFDDQSDEPESPVYIGRIVRHLPSDDPYANFELSMEWIDYSALQAELDNDELDEFDSREVICLFENDDATSCPSNNPSLVYSSALSTNVGIVFDADYDGVASLFDPNDNDPNIPGDPSSGGGDFINEGLAVSMLFESDGASGVEQSFLVETFNLYPGEIQSVIMETDVFGAESGEQVVFTCSPPSEDTNGNYEDFSCSARSVAGGVTSALQFSNGGGVGFKLTVPQATLDELGNNIDFNYKIKFRAPTDLNGNPYMCGTEACPARPEIEGEIFVTIPTNTPTVFEDLSVTQGSGQPESFDGLIELDVSRDVLITGVPIPGAFDYELSIYCPGSSATDDEWYPEEFIEFYSPARDETGRTQQPEFIFNTPWIGGGRTCSFTVNAYMENNVGEFIGTSSISFDSVRVVGGGNDFNNETRAIVGQSVCLVTGADGVVRVETDYMDETGSFMGCATENSLDTTLFTIDSMEGNEATISLGSSVTDAYADGGRKVLTEGLLGTDTFVTINYDSSTDQPPTCGYIANQVAVGEYFIDEYSDTCADGEDLVTTDILYASVLESGERILSLTQDMIDAGLTIDGSGGSNQVSLQQPGFYKVVEVSDGYPVMEIEINAYPIDDAGTMEVYGRFTLTSGANSYNGMDDSPIFNISAPGYMYVNLNGQPIDFDLRFIRGNGDGTEGEMKFNWFVSPPKVDLNSDLDLDGDGAPEIFTEYIDPTWTLTFSSVISSVKQFGDTEPQEVTANDNGTYTLMLDDSMYDYAYVEVELNGMMYGINIDLFSNSVEWYNFSGGDDKPGECYDCPEAGANIWLTDDQVTTLYYTDEMGYNFESGSEIANISVMSNAIELSLSEQASTMNFYIWNHDTGESETAGYIYYERFGGFFWVDVKDDNNQLPSFAIEIQDYDIDVQISIWPVDENSCNDCGTDTYYDLDGDGITDDMDDDIDGDGVLNEDDEDPYNPDIGLPRDIDGDGIADVDDNCIAIANVDQAINQETEEGLACESTTSIDVTGVWNISGFDSYINTDGFTCPIAGDSEPFGGLVHVTMQGNQFFMRSFAEPDESKFFMVGIFDGSSFALYEIADHEMSSDMPMSQLQMVASGLYDESQDSLSFSEEYIDEDDEACTVTVEGMLERPADDVVEETAAMSGLTWTYGEMDMEPTGQTWANFEYGTITDTGSGTTEEFFEYNSSTSQWVTNSEIEMQYSLTEFGIVEAEDIATIVGYGLNGETMSLEVGSQSFDLDLYSVSIEGKPVVSYLPDAFEYAIPEDTLFTAGAMAYIGQTSNESEIYHFWCDDDGEDWFIDNLICDNAVFTHWNFDEGTQENTPVPAMSIDDLVNQDDGFGNLVGDNKVTVWMSHNIFVELRSESGMINDETLSIEFYKSYHGADGSEEPLGSGTLTLQVVGDFTLYFFNPPENVMLEHENIFFFEESEIESTDVETVTIVRRGQWRAAMNDEPLFFFNDTAKSDILESFQLMLDDGSGTGTGGESEVDSDNDGYFDFEDNCPQTPNPDQTDSDDNGIGDACELAA